jgi:hypothetical protein
MEQTTEFVRWFEDLGIEDVDRDSELVAVDFDEGCGRDAAATMSLKPDTVVLTRQTVANAEARVGTLAVLVGR